MSFHTSTALVVRGAQPVMRLNAKAIDFDLIGKYAAALSGGDRMPGDLLTYSQGEYFVGSGTGKKAIKPGFELVVNMPNLMFAWRKWEDGRPFTPHMAYPLVGETLPPRAEMGDDDKDAWELMKKDGKIVKNDDGQTIPLDPWQTVAILMARDDNGALLRFECSNVSSKMAVAALVTEYAEQGKRHPDELPVVTFADQKLKRKGSTDKYFAPMFEIVGWEKATKEDFPEGGVALATGDEEEAPKPGKGKAQTRALPKPEVDEEDEKPSRTAKVTRMSDVKVSARDEEEEEKPRARRAAREEPAEEEEVKAPRRRGLIAA